MVACIEKVNDACAGGEPAGKGEGMLSAVQGRKAALQDVSCGVADLLYSYMVGLAGESCLKVVEREMGGTTANEFHCTMCTLFSIFFRATEQAQTYLKI